MATFLLLALLTPSVGAVAAPSSDPSDFLRDLTGVWRGTGPLRGPQEVTVQVVSEWTFDRWLKMHFLAVTGDPYEMEAWICYNQEARRYEMLEFDSSAPARLFTGSLDHGKLVLEDARKNRLVFERVDPITLKLSRGAEGSGKAMGNVTFKQMERGISIPSKDARKSGN